MTDCDVLVIGAGPAGAVAAANLARAGLAVRLVDRKPFPRRKVCGACLSGYAIGALQEARLADVLDGAVPLTSFRLAARRQSATVLLGGGCVLSRSTLDAALVGQAVAAGVTFDDATTAEVGPVDDDSRVVTLSTSHSSPTREEVRASVILVAAGLTGAAFRHDPELRSTPTLRARIGAGAETEAVERFFTPGTIFMATHRAGYVGLVRTEADTLNIAAALDPRFVTAEGGLGPAAAAVVRSAGFPADGLADLNWTGTPPLSRRPASVAAERVFLIGDAAGYIEPFTGEGIGWAIGAANAVVPFAQKATEGWSPELAAEWAATYRRTIGRRQRLCRLVAAGLRSPSLVSAAVRLLGPFPSAAGPVLRHLTAT